MKKIPIPKSKHKRALILVDIQRGFLKGWKGPLLKNLEALLAQESYDLYVEATFHAEKGSLWDTQVGWTFPYEPSVTSIREFLSKKKPVVSVVKETKSAFKGDKNLAALLR
jgi:hypothetical protein